MSSGDQLNREEAGRGMTAQIVLAITVLAVLTAALFYFMGNREPIHGPAGGPGAPAPGVPAPPP
jgi:hypothetical protein